MWKKVVSYWKIIREADVLEEQGTENVPNDNKAKEEHITWAEN